MMFNFKRYKGFLWYCSVSILSTILATMQKSWYYVIANAVGLLGITAAMCIEEKKGAKTK